MKKYILITILAFLFPVTIWGNPPPFIPQETVALVFSSNVHGELEPCG
ncbi:MAG: hypothetical protein NTV04_22620 [Deltaproteobacteria bacterium]|nr:hypothetical protein [Deltaproteobacteria bacterium]